ncbi:MAG: hypothetical protein GX957_03970 [Clostridiaceae bacterium]|nr:hypothetical protein [Clostridiaceae bacterium]
MSFRKFVDFLNVPNYTGNEDFIYDDNLVEKEDGYRLLLPVSFVRKQTGTFVHLLPELLPTEIRRFSQPAFFL